jgi:rubrerythrin
MGRPCRRKVKYPDQAAAFRAAMKVRRSGKGEQDIYRCPTCGHFHTTHAKKPRPGKG